MIAATIMLPPVLADLALNVKKATRTRALIVIIGALLALVSLVLYGFAFANDLSREADKPLVAVNLSANSVATWSMVFFLSAVVLGAICAAFLAGEMKPANQQESR